MNLEIGITPNSGLGWLRSHWKLLLVFALSVALLSIVAVFSIIRNSDAAQLAIRVAQSSPELAGRVGQPVKPGWLISGNIEVTPASGHAELAIPVSGPRGAGTIYVEARKTAGLWRLQLLEFGAKGSDDRLNLLPSATQ